MNKMPFPPAYQNFFRLGLVLKEHVSPETVVASRKGELLYMFSGTRVAGYAYSQDDRAVIQKMLDDGVEYVILDQLGYSSTPRYLYPAIQKNDDLFFVASHVPNPDTYLLKFDREPPRKNFLNPNGKMEKIRYLRAGKRSFQFQSTDMNTIDKIKSKPSSPEPVPQGSPEPTSYSNIQTFTLSYSKSPVT